MKKTIKRIVSFKNYREYWDFRTEYLNEQYVPSNKDENLPLSNIFGIIYDDGTIEIKDKNEQS